MEYLKLLVELAKAIAWPSAVFGLGFMFRSDVRELFPRLKKAGPAGLEFDPARQVLAAPSKQLKDLPGFPERSPVIAKVETSLHSELELMDPDKRVDLLIRHLAVARLAWNFEQIYRTLFGSQIRALRALHSSGGKTSRAESAAYFDQVKSEFPQFYEKNTFDEWVRYPISTGLITSTSDEIAITDFGEEFLKYIDEKGLSESSKTY
ncbi:hypothetical protein JQ636_08605 [Bradyrhizobium japonicum]|uniref:hypothetical protein n=1 Tax=Bradyrhizobium japonicum TaxID=375 RepID=UPI001BA9CABD|nr:hypothetical protein [Bradyrhizobium japonicum]MBR0803594.1 hypothetical protein [Bradyrhizobium japonicum]